MFFSISQGQPAANRIPVAIIGLTHDHVHGILRQWDRADLQLVGIVETNTALSSKYQERYQFPQDLLYTDLITMLEHESPQAVFGFGSTWDHLQIVEACAPRGIDVMVEKPLAVNMEHALAMKKLVEEFDITLLVNYETTWYPSNHLAKTMVVENQLGDIRKVVVHDGHEGPREIGCSEEFLAWLTDPKLNGGGALTDFGCYGANLMTWLMEGKKPTKVTAFTHTNKPEMYPRVDDEATILLQYDTAQCIIQASWNWPFSRKDMEVYGENGCILADDARQVRVRKSDQKQMETRSLSDLTAPRHEPFGYFIKVITGALTPSPFSLSSLENNMIVTEILDAARESAGSGKAIKL